ncbi:PQQ-binding-like beta-propeller repeat protein [Microtetraspora malaysiensis]|uniref:outer membrane protein assembly factor BamB family protein n=1 Tax=Microtetraspora malaysiensis TaxID=161358 RepID=UPI003D8EF4FE
MNRPHAKVTLTIASAALLTSGALAGCSQSDAAAAKKYPTWQNSEVNAVSRITTGAGVAATTSMKPDGTLETVALDEETGRKLWSAPATMTGRLPGMGVQPPTIVDAGSSQTVVAAIDPVKQGQWNATLVTRDAHTGRQKWTRPVHSTFGPQQCGPYICLSEHTALSTARLVVLDPLTGKTIWRLPGIAEVEWSDPNRVVLLRLASHPVLEAHDMKTGKSLWQLPVEQALGEGVNMSGGWSFGSTGTTLVGYVAPYTDARTKKTSPFGLFSVRLTDGVLEWMRPSVVRVYPSGNPALSPVVRPVDQQGQYGGFARLNGESGRVVGQITAAQVPGTGWWLAFPPKMETLGFLKHSAPGTAFNMINGEPADVKGAKGWSFCVTDPQPLKLTGVSPGFYSIAALCEFDLATGKRMDSADTPPTWFTGSQSGWRIWRDEKGGLHAIKDGTTTSPGMYG